MVMFSTVKAQSSTDTKESARIFVQKFYDWYAIMDADDGFAKKHNASPFSYTVSKRGSYFETLLRKELVNYFRVPTNDDDIGLDFDPISAAQDTRSGFQTGNVKQVGNKFQVDIHDIKSGRQRKEVLAAELALIAEVTNVNGRWEFSNFIYPSPDGKSDLMSILKKLNHDRKKNPAKK